VEVVEGWIYLKYQPFAHGLPGDFSLDTKIIHFYGA
jgi:hypothetical protein